jgi:hypothetical protein
VKRLRSIVLAILVLGLLTTPAWADGGHGRGNGQRWSYQSFNQTFDAGPGNAPWWAGNRPRAVMSIFLASGRAAGGQPDPRVTVTPPGGSAQSAIVCSNLVPGWAGPLEGSNWDSLQADCTTGLAGGANFQYSTTFRLPANRRGVAIAGNVLADDSVVIQLNGNTIFSGGGFGSASAFSSNNAAYFTTGTNTLTFTVYNVTGPSGLDFVAHVQARPGQAIGQRRGDFDDDGD